MKKILSIIGIVVVIALLGLVSYYFFVYDEVNPETGEKVSFREFLPFGSSPESETGSFNEGTGETGGEEGGSIIPVVMEDFVKISDNPVAGAIALETASGTVVRYMERATGHVYDFETFSGREVRVTNTTVPKIQEVTWYPNGRAAILRFLSDEEDFINTVYATLSATTSPEGLYDLELAYLESNIDSVTALGSSGKSFLISKNPAGSNGFTLNANGGGKTIVLRSAVREWLSQGVDASSVALVPKPASYAEGYVYLLNAGTGALQKVYGPRLGLTALVSPTKSYALISESGNGFQTKLFALSSKSEIGLGAETLPEKCVWTKSGDALYCGVPRERMAADFLDLWYQGIVSPTDDLWRIEVPTGDIRKTLSPDAEKDGSMDMTNLGIDSEGKHLYFINKKDYHLWLIKLKQDDETEEE